VRNRALEKLDLLLHWYTPL